MKDSPAWKRTEQTILKLGSIYGHLFSSQYKTDEALDDMIVDWGESIGYYPYARLCRAIKRCKATHKNTVNLVQFEDCVKLTKNDVLERDYLAEKNTPRLEKIVTPQDREKRIETKNKFMAKMKAGLSKANPRKHDKPNNLEKLEYNEAELLNDLKPIEEVDHVGS